MWKYITFLCLLTVLMAIQSCYYDDPPAIQPIDPASVSYTTHVVPILEKSCSTSSCHDGTSEPNLTTTVAWTNLRSGGFINTTIPEESYLYKSVSYLTGADPMPPGGPQIPEVDRQVILAWIQNGAPDN